jgi:hypothetical protein
MIFWILSGMLLLSEIEFYTPRQLVGITIAIILCIGGVYLLKEKKTFMAREVIYEDSSNYA